MKKNIFTIVLALLCQFVSAHIQDSFSFSLSDFSFDSVGQYVRITYDDYTYTEDIGWPELPRIEVKYAIPYDSYVSGLTVTNTTVQMLQGTYLINPRQPATSVGNPSPDFVIDSSAYRSNLPYIGCYAEVSDQYYEMGFHIAVINVYPFSYIPAQSRLFLCSSLSFSLQCSLNNDSPVTPRMVSRQMLERSKNQVKTWVKNVSDVDASSPGSMRVVELNEQVPTLIPIMQSSQGALPEYIIITNNNDVNGNPIESYQGKNMTDYFQELADWKTKKGVPTVVVTVDDICANYTGNDKQAKIHNFLNDVYTQYGWMNVLLGGDVNVVPERMIDSFDVHNLVSNEETCPPFPSDLYYNAVGTSWDTNGNGIFGETSPGPEDYEDHNTKFYLGRSPVKDCKDASVFLKKDTTYEKMSNVSNRSYVNNLGFITGDTEDDTDVYNHQIHEYVDSHIGLLTIDYENGQPYNTTISGITQSNIVNWRLFEDNYLFDSIDILNNTVYSTLHSIGWENHSMTLGRGNVISSLGNGFPISMQLERPHIVYHYDHSSYRSMGTSTKRHNESINRIDVDNLGNVPYYQILMTQGCSPGEFQKDCIVEHFLNNPNGGAVAAIASSALSSTYELQNFQKLISHLYYCNNFNGNPCTPTSYHLGAIHNHYHFNSHVFYRRKNHLFGDPDLPIWTREPVDLTVSTSPSTISNQNHQLTVSVSGMAYSEYATNDVMVCVMKDGEVYLREPYDDVAHSHNFVFDVYPETAGELKVTVTGHNYIPYETAVPVSITGKNVYISQKAVLDANGNNDGKLDAGETVNLSIALKNNGTVALTNVHAVLSCEFTDPAMNLNPGSYLTLTTANATYGTIAKNATVTRSNYQFTLSNTVPDTVALRCTLTVSDGTGTVGVKTFTLPIGTPKMEYVSLNHCVKPNGRIGLDIELTNTGSGTAKGVTATLASQDVQVSAGTASYGSVSHLQSKTRSFEFIPNGNIDGSAFTLTVTDAYNKSWSFSFDVNTVSDTVQNLAFESTEHSIKMIWDPVVGSIGYNVYRSRAWNGDYERMNNYPIPSSAYPDLGLDPKRTYCYGVTFLDSSGNESPMARTVAWTSLPVAEGWPVSVSDVLGRPWGTAPNVADIDGDGKQEVFLTSGSGDNKEDYGAVLAFNHLGKELYDIDHNPTTVSGFANPGISMTCTPAIGDIDDDGVMEIVVATRDNLNDNHKLLVYKNRDTDQDGAPDLAWEHTLEFKNFNGVVLADLNDDGTLEIIVPNQGRHGQSSNTGLEVFDCHGNCYPNCPIELSDPQNTDNKAVTMPVVADLDNDGSMEVVFGLESGVYKWCGSNTPPTCLTPNQTGRMDCPVVVADIDGDGYHEVLYMSIVGGRGYIKAVRPNGSAVSAWSGNSHGIALSGSVTAWEWPAYFIACDIDWDGDVEVLAADSDTLKMWNGDGSPFGAGTITVGGLDCRYMQPLVADVDGNGDCEIVVPSQNGYIYAYRTDGSAVPGWPLAVPDLATIPAIADLDGDGYNEVVAASQTELYVWHTEGESRYNQCDRFRYDRHNNAVYEIPCSHVATPLEITGTKVWNGDRRFDRDVVVNSGASLTVKSDLRFSEGSRIIVKKGGRLVVDGGRLAGSCPDVKWKGIEVWGDSTLQQQQVNGSYLQGYLELKNGAVIEDALCAVNLQNPLDNTTTGGIVHATGALFRNNAKAVHIGHYTGHDEISGGELSYNSWFRDCVFVIDGNYLCDATFNSHVSLDGVDGVTFSGCAFSADRGVTGVSPTCYGIDAYNSLFMVNQYCGSLTRPCPEQDLVRSSFSGFHQGVHAVGDGQRLAVPQVCDSDFSDNDIGLFCRATGFVLMVNDSIAMGDADDCSIGLYADAVTGLTVEENDFRTPSGNNAGNVTYGTVIIDSRTASDVYLNSFHGLDYGNLSIGQNAIITYDTLGLTYTCNVNEANRVDFYIADIANTLSGIQPHQGSSRAPAGNTFSGSQYHIYNDGDYQVHYHYDNTEPDQIPASSKLYGVTATTTTGSNRCLSHYGEQPSKGSDADNANSEDDSWEELVGRVRGLFSDTVVDNAALRNVLMRFGSPDTDRLAVTSLMAEGDTVGAIALAETLPERYGFKGGDLEEHGDYMRLLHLYNDLKRTGRTATELTSEELSVVREIAEEGRGMSRAMAETLLEGTSGNRDVKTYCPDDYVTVRRGTTGSDGGVALHIGDNALNGMSVKVSPSPATTFATVEYVLPNGAKQASLNITNVLGVRMLTVELEGNRGSKAIDLSRLAGGVYFYTVRYGEHTVTGKLVVKR